MVYQLPDRRQRVKIGSCFSSYEVINIGVPQGSILGPLLFLLYIDDLPQVTGYLSPILFADDTTLSASHIDHQELVTRVTEELVHVTEWTLLHTENGVVIVTKIF